MTAIKDPIGFGGRMSATILMSVTPEYKKVVQNRKAGAGQAESRDVEFNIKPEYKTIAGINVRFAQAGKEDGPTILLLCPLPQSILCYDLIWNKLGEHCKVVALDIPGFGRSDGGLEVMSFKAQGDFLEAFINELGLKDVHIVGPDVGMAVALHYVIHHEHKAASIIVGDGPGILPSINGSIINKAVDSAFWRMMFRVTGATAFVEGGYRLACLNYTPSFAEVADYVASYKERIGPVTHWFKTYPENLATTDPYLADLDLPVQIFWGEQDYFLLKENAHALQGRLKRSQLKIFEKCGHYSYQDQPDEFAEMIINWIQEGHRNL